MKWRDPDAAFDRLYQAAEGQSGYFTARQAVEAGYSRPLHTYHVRKGHWLKIDRGIFRLKNFPSSRYEDLVRWTLWSQGRAVISHETAAAVHELGDLMPARIHLTVEPGFRKPIPPILVVHRDRIPSVEVGDREGFRITNPLRTVLDLIRYPMDLDHLAGVIGDALDRGAVRREVLESEIAKMDVRFRECGFLALRASGERYVAI